MSKSHQKSNREARKPKADKPKAAVAAMPFLQAPKAANPKKGSAGKKAR